MLDINFIRENKELVKKAVQEKGVDVDIEHLLEVDQKRRQLITEVDVLRQQRNVAAKEKNIELGKKVKEQLVDLEDQLRRAEEQFKTLMLYVPNIPSSDSPVGPNSDANEEVLKWGEIPEFDFPIKDHTELGKLLDIIDLEAGAKTSGFRGYYLKNEGAVLHWAVLQYALAKIISKGFKPVVPPTLVREDVLIGSGHFPFGKENIYQITNPGKLETGEEIKNPLFLTGTSEPSLLAYFKDQLLEEDDLPIKVCALTHCFRSEIGDYGKDTKGLFRVHEFDKVEQVIICKDSLEESEKLFTEMQKISEEVLQELGLPYHVVATSTGDMGAGKYRMNDIETWMPSREKYSETHSNSNLTDWQSRRANIRFKNKNGETKIAYALNNTVIASPRILIAILENFQQEDGSIKIPEVLQKYTGFSEIKPK
ncbi:MAG: serine--tRNA ligase [Candidatus Daviesbacteria bacterium]|nr:serine--tRNA ligase [Candidatus Daviesbacteria bacterium]